MKMIINLNIQPLLVFLFSLTGSSYISLPWLCGQAMFGELSLPVTILTIFYSLAGLGKLLLIIVDGESDDDRDDK